MDFFTVATGDDVEENNSLLSMINSLKPINGVEDPIIYDFTTETIDIEHNDCLTITGATPEFIYLSSRLDSSYPNVIHCYSIQEKKITTTITPPSDNEQLFFFEELLKSDDFNCLENVFRGADGGYYSTPTEKLDHFCLGQCCNFIRSQAVLIHNGRIPYMFTKMYLLNYLPLRFSTYLLRNMHSGETYTLLTKSSTRSCTEIKPFFLHRRLYYLATFDDPEDCYALLPRKQIRKMVHPSCYDAITMKKVDNFPVTDVNQFFSGGDYICGVENGKLVVIHT